MHHIIKICEQCSNRYCGHCSTAGGEDWNRFCSKECRQKHRDAMPSSQFKQETRDAAKPIATGKMGAFHYLESVCEEEA